MGQFQTVELPQRLPLVVFPANRTSSIQKDSRLVNCYLETDPTGDLWVWKRPGMLEAFSSPAAEGQGLFFWQGDAYSILNGTLYRNGITAVPPAVGLDQTNGVYRFNQILGGNPKMVFGNGKKTYAYNLTDGLTGPFDTIDPNFPAETVKGIAYLDGTTYVMTPGSDIRGSLIDNVDSPTSWSILNLIQARSEPDPGVYLAKQNVYVVALGSWSQDPFFNAGNPQGSPLQVVEGQVVKFGCLHADSVQEIDDRLFWMSTGQNAAIQFSMLDKMNHSIISDDAIDRLIKDADIGNGRIFSWRCKLEGHNFYICTIKNLNLTLAYDVEEQKWTQWTDENGNYLPIVDSSYDSQKRLILQHESNGKVYYMGYDFTNDAGSPIVVDIYTPEFDAETIRRKQLNMMRFVGDKTPGSILYVRSNDKDYDPESWSNFRKVDLNQPFPFLTNCGTFVRRAYHFRHTANTRFRMRAVDVQYDVGTL